MLKIHRFTLVLFSAVCASGCSSLGVMEETSYIATPPENMGLINVVRPAIFLGDGVKFEAWDGSKFIGTLTAGSMLQYAANEGSHCIMVDPTQGGKWAKLNVDVKNGSVYYIKPNTIPFVGLKLGIADEDDPRKAVWAEHLTPYSLNSEKTEPIPEDIVNKAKENSLSCS